MGFLDQLNKGLGSALDKTGISKSKDLVEDLWDKRAEILHAIAWVRDHGEDLVHFMQHVPELLGKVGDAMDGAGQAAHTASGFLGIVGKPAHDGGATVSHLAGQAGDSLGRAQAHIGSVAKVLSDLAGHFGDVPLIGEAIAGKTNEGSHLIGNFSDEMADIAKKLGHLAERVGVVSGHLHHVGNGLVESSTMLKSLTK
jgi:hypothetical protein